MDFTKNSGIAKKNRNGDEHMEKWDTLDRQKSRFHMVSPGLWNKPRVWSLKDLFFRYRFKCGQDLDEDATVDITLW